MPPLLKLTICIILQVCLFMSGAPDPSYAQDQKSHEREPGLAPTPITLQINQILDFSDTESQTVELVPETYQLIPTPSNNLQFISTETPETIVVRATTFRHAEPISATSTILIQDEETEERLHLLLFFPDGQGWDAEGWVRGQVRSRGGEFYSALFYSPKQRYTAVVIQQGPVNTDADWNEEEAPPSSENSAPHSTFKRSYGQVKLEQGRLQLDAKAQKALWERCRLFAKEPVEGNPSHLHMLGD